MNVIYSVLSLCLLFFVSFPLAAEGSLPGRYEVSFEVSGFPGVMPAAVQRSRVNPGEGVETGYVLVNVLGADDITDVLLHGGQVAARAVRGQGPGNVSADFSSPIPSDPGLILSVTKLSGRGGVTLAGRPGRENDHNVTVRIVDPAPGRDNYRFRIDWRLPASRSRALPRRTDPVTRNTRNTGGLVSGRLRSSGPAETGYVELQINGVDEVLDVSIRGSEARLVTMRGRNPGRAEALFSNPVPTDRGVSLDVAKSYGRGSVSIIERPSPTNDFTTLIRLEDPRGGSDNYKFRLDWSRSSPVRTRSSAAPRDSVGAVRAESGKVEVEVEGADDVLDIMISGDRVEYSAIRGGTPRRVASDFSTPLPRIKPDRMLLNKEKGRGEIILVEGPDRDNGYTATVRIVDSERAQDDYRFTLAWEVSGSEPPSGPGYENNLDNSVATGGYQRITAYTGSTFQYTREGSFQFRAVVDETALIKIEDGAVWGMVQRGQPMRILDARFSAGYPRGEMELLELTRTRGRGEVEILEKPWSGNNYSIVIRIHDSRGGDDEYAFELRWKQR